MISYRVGTDLYMHFSYPPKFVAPMPILRTAPIALPSTNKMRRAGVQPIRFLVSQSSIDIEVFFGQVFPVITFFGIYFLSTFSIFVSPTDRKIVRSSVHVACRLNLARTRIGFSTTHLLKVEAKAFGKGKRYPCKGSPHEHKLHAGFTRRSHCVQHNRARLSRFVIRIDEV
ncbi:MAG: hypothetical protein NXY57DRAFT_1085784 [Lentinula lateritia]|nr:MAG: hypothetical protein NXY57DRAFT_1085784 [Lentinula lateritia]